MRKWELGEGKGMHEVGLDRLRAEGTSGEQDGAGSPEACLRAMSPESQALSRSSPQASSPLGLWRGALAVLQRLRSCWGRLHRVCVRVHLAQPFSLQVWS